MTERGPAWPTKTSFCSVRGVVSESEAEKADGSGGGQGRDGRLMGVVAAGKVLRLGVSGVGGGTTRWSAGSEGAKLLGRRCKDDDGWDRAIVISRDRSHDRATHFQNNSSLL
jgi:hypothetical protein